MRLGGRKSTNIEDRRGMGVPLVAGGGIGTVIIALLYFFLGGDPSTLPLPQPGSGASSESREIDPAQKPLVDMVELLLADTEDVWKEELPKQAGTQYRFPKLVLFSDVVQSACGTAQSASGPFYCPLDEKVYIDLRFYNELDSRFGAPGDFAQAYVIAHEVGHHIQTILGISEKVHSARRQTGEVEANQLSVAQELQADCFAGVFANHAQRTQQFLEPGDLEEGLRAASAIGDDTIQRRTQGRVVPESFTHGSAAQRVEWFKRGFQSGQMAQCDTFNSL